MRKNNEEIVLSGNEALSALVEIEYLLISLRNIGRYYHADQNESGDVNLKYSLETTRFIRFCSEKSRH